MSSASSTTPGRSGGNTTTTTLTTTTTNVASSSLPATWLYWNDDFTPLEAAGQAILQALREDEAAPDADLYRRISASGDGSHLYFMATAATATASLDSVSSLADHRPSSTAATSFTVEHCRTIPLPSPLSEQWSHVREGITMGLFAPRAPLAWMIVDSTVFLWPFASLSSSFQSSSSSSLSLPSSAAANCCRFQVPSGQPIVSVGLVRPKPGK